MAGQHRHTHVGGASSVDAVERVRLRETSSVRGQRTDIQGLRAIAVAAVVVYHVSPHRLPGGFVGVDIFFAISGFLITSHLMTHPPTRVANLLDFWSRRIRRLLPAAFTVLAVTLLLSRLVAPATQWDNTARQVRAAVLYVVNWRLADDAVDYLQATAAPSPVQHFWSLAVEEQFYLLWPVLILVASLVARLSRRRPSTFVAGASTVLVIASFWYSVHETANDPGRAYFVTPTRVWELGIGGLLAMAVAPASLARPRMPSLPEPVRVVLVWAGLGALTWSIVGYDANTPFPSWRALLPTLGCVAVIAAADPRSTRLTPGRLLALRPVQWLGDVSYSVYLWHFPLVVLVPNYLGHPLNWWEKAALLVATGVLAAATKRFVEDPFRRPRRLRRVGWAFVLAAAGMAVVGSATVLQTHEVHADEVQARRQLAALEAGGDPCFGAPALQHGATRCRPVTSGTLHPSAQAAKDDKPTGFNTEPGEPGCFSLMPDFTPKTCVFGSSHPTARIALVGNSHAYELTPALRALAARNGWQVTTYIAQRCVYSDVTTASAKVAAAQATCFSWVHWATRQLTSHPYDLVLMVNRSDYPGFHPTFSPNATQYTQGFASVLDALHAAHRRVLGVRDTPTPDQNIPDCLAAHTGDYTACDGSRATWLVDDPLTRAIAERNDPQITETDLTSYVCEPTRCPAVIGSVPVYFDDSHLSATFVRTLAPYVEPVITRALTR